MKSSFDGALRTLGLLVSAVVPAVLAAAGSGAVAPASHDDGVVRTMGAGFTGAFHALDLVIAAPALLLPIGTRALRAGLASAVVAGVCGALAFDVARCIVRAVPAVLRRLGLSVADEVSPRLGAAVAAVCVLTAVTSPAWQAEASAPAGAVTGVLLVLLALRLAISVHDEDAGRPMGGGPLPELGFVAGLAASYEPFTLVALVAAVAPWIVSARRKVVFGRTVVLRSACAFALGLAPLALGLALSERAPEIALPVPTFSLYEAAASPVSLRALVSADVGVVFLVACLGGGAMSFLVVEARPLAASLTLLSLVGGLAVSVHAAAGPDRYAAAVLVGLLSLHVLAATTLATLVLAIARAPVPFAEASAALVVVLELALPARSIDETLSRRDSHSAYAAAVWNDVAWGAAPPAAVLLVAARGTMARIAATRAAGAMRGDLLVVPSYDVQGRAGQNALVAEPKLAPLYRDVVLGLPPEELALAQLGAQRAVLATFDPKWDRALSRHLVPVALTSRFEPEPRGASDRKRGLEAFLPAREQLIRATVAKKDAELAAATAALLRPRAIGMAATGERDMLDRALDDLRMFSPRDPLETVLVRRLVTSKGPIEVKDLTP